jgi:hypothetical protein
MNMVYVDSSAIVWAVTQLFRGETLASALASEGLRPVVGMHTLSSLGESVFERGETELGMGAFSLIREMRSSFVPSARRILAYEVLSLRTGQPVNPFVETLTSRALHMEIQRLARGIFDSRSRYFIQTREARAGFPSPILNISWLEERLGHDGLDERRLKALSPSGMDEIMAAMGRELKEMVQEIFGRKITPDEAELLSRRLDSYPALSASVRANIFLMSIDEEERNLGVGPQSCLQLVEASYCYGILTQDPVVTKTAHAVVPWLKVMDCEHLAI